MPVPLIRLRILILAAYLLAAVLPGLALGGGPQQSGGDHAMMMAMAGDMGQMPASDGAEGDAHRVLCQQHCLFAVADFPALERSAETLARASDVDAASGVPVVSLAIPPPGPPPKIAVM